ncbi:hypothetical protein HRbin16_00291 [bacterium HR16]|nr:hypothetical protein HRbin16_00291 [bacterium HR16]
MSASRQYVFAVMRAILFVALVLAGSVAVPVRADDLAPPPWRGAPGSDWQHWEFRTNGPLPDAWNNPYGVPTENVALRSNATWHNSFGGRQGVWELRDGYMQWEIPDDFQPHLPKWVRIQFTVNIANFNWAGNPTFIGPVTQLETDPQTNITWYHHWADYVLPCQPFSVFLQGTLAVDQLVVDSVCVPEPGSMLLSTIGLGVVGAAFRRRRKA